MLPSSRGSEPMGARSSTPASSDMNAHNLSEVRSGVRRSDREQCSPIRVAIRGQEGWARAHQWSAQRP